MSHSILMRALCTDIDGTLLNIQRELSVRTIAAISKIRDKMPVILASSRMPSAMRHLQKDLGLLSHPLICYNGGYVIKYNGISSSPTVIHSAQIPVSICSAILGLAQNTSIHVSLYEEDHWYAPGMDEWAMRESQVTRVTPNLRSGVEVLDMWRENNVGAHKVMCMGRREEIGVVESTLRLMFPTQIHVYHSKSTYLEIAPKTISKASALSLLLRELYDIPLSEVIAFGDNHNDIELLQSVGLGIAVANARDEVKAVAKEITGKSTDDGVALAIDKYFN